MKKKLMVILAMSLTVPFLAVSVGQAANNVIYGCYQKNKGQMRVLAKKAKCLPSEVALSWNMVGPQGPQGLQGPEGPIGPTGPQGPAGVLGFYTVTTPFTVDLPGQSDFGSSCLDGDQVTGGGYTVTPLAGAKVVASLPSEGDSSATPPVAPGWKVSIDNSEAAPWDGSVYAVCADIP